MLFKKQKLYVVYAEDILTIEVWSINKFEYIGVKTLIEYCVKEMNITITPRIDSIFTNKAEAQLELNRTLKGETKWN
jgi:hypothetical protein